MRLLSLLAILCLASQATLAEGFYDAKVEAIDDSQWPRVNVLFKVYDESFSAGVYPSSLVRPTPYGCERGLEKRGWSCWDIDLQENGRRVLDIHQISVPYRPAENWSYLWLSFHSSLDSAEESLLTLHLDIPEWGVRSVGDQEPLQLYSAQDPALVGSPWKFMLRRSDQQLNTSYQDLLKNIPEADQTLLRDAQLAWLKFRNAQCPPQLKSMQTRCLYMATQGRAEELQQQLRELR
nr:lysozyme inhibitor LprI family protein [Pseudomonas sp. UBA6718]